MRLFFLVTLTLLLWFVSISDKNEAQAQTCLVFDTISYNPDSTYVDTCGSSATYLGRYCRRAYRVDFDRYVIHSPVFSFDTALVYEWTAIDTAFSDIRNGFEALEGEVGNFTLTKLAAYIDDTSSELNRAFIMRFDSLLNVDSVLSQLLSIPGVNNARWYGMPRHYTYIPNDKSMKPNIDFNQIALDESSVYNRRFHERGWQWNLYSIKCPMAWEISKGKASIHVVGSDYFGGQSTQNPDMVPNFIEHVISNPGAGQRVKGNGLSYRS